MKIAISTEAEAKWLNDVFKRVQPDKGMEFNLTLKKRGAEKFHFDVEVFPDNLHWKGMSPINGKMGCGYIKQYTIHNKGAVK